jgi:glycerophosphoryl diester phosphodiesterase
LAPYIIAHRGDSATRPENTLASFRRALEVGADLVELDVQLSKDGHAVVIHDGTLDRTTDGTGKVGELSLAELRKFSAGYPEKFNREFAKERIPSLAEVLLLIRGKARVMIEIKKESVAASDEDGIEAKVVGDVMQAGMADDVAIISFERRALVRCARLGHEILRGPLFYRSEVDEVIAGAREVDAAFVMPEKGMINDALADAAHAARIKVATWVVDDPDELRSLMRFDLYGVGTNCPGVLLDAIWESE